jgi:hypothetical protein
VLRYTIVAKPVVKSWIRVCNAKAFIMMIFLVAVTFTTDSKYGIINETTKSI